MTSQSIFKMELFKFLKDRMYVMISFDIGLLNIILSILMVAAPNYTVASPLYMSFFSVLNLFEFVFILYYTYRSLARDYQTHMLGTMVTSLKSRGSLFFARLASFIALFLILSAVFYLIPMIIVVIPLQLNFDIRVALLPIFEALGVSNVYLWVLIFSVLLAALLVVIMLFTATVIMEGKVLSFALTSGFIVGMIVIDSLFFLIFNSMNTGMTVYLVLTWLIHLLAMGLFSSFGSFIMKRQNL